METKKEYKITNQGVWVSSFLFHVTFEYNGESYTAQSQYINGGWGMDDIEVCDDTGQEPYDEEIVAIGEKLLYDLEINKDTITW